MAYTNHLRNAGEYAKAVAGFLTALAGGLGVLVGVSADLPGVVQGALVAASAAVSGAAVYVTRNTDTLDRAGDAAADLLDRR